VLVVVVLQLALAGLVADGAVDRVVEQQELLHVGLRLVTSALSLLTSMPSARRLLARGLELGLAVGDVVVLLRVPLRGCRASSPSGDRGDLHQAHAAVGRDAEAGVPAVVRDLDARRHAA
jgi:hypothetical protein